jgi:hypothetical protein
MSIRTTLLSITLAALASSTARAECRSDEDAAARKPVAFHMAQVDGKLTMVLDDGIVVCGHVPRPAVAIVPSPTTSEYVWESLANSLLPKIVESVKQAPLSGGSR